MASVMSRAVSLQLGKHCALQESVPRVLACSTGSTGVTHPQEVHISELSGDQRGLCWEWLWAVAWRK